MTNGPYANPRMLFQPATSASRAMEATTPKYNRSDTSPDTQSSPAMMRDHGMSSIHWQHERQQRAGSSGSGNFGGSSNSVGRMQHQQQSPAMSQHLPHPSHPSQLSIQSRSSVNSHTTTGSTSSSLNQPSPQERGYTFAEPEGVHDKKTTPNSTPVFNRKGTKKQMTSVSIDCMFTSSKLVLEIILLYYIMFLK
ncbi:hypothetical protein EB796_020990 [Bugula neritina]|uniref:Uncharacterized protein n=1 Tax=Bugula neritina TaxID=10212 RepID=A0A7J7J3L5_BUGNE|nr:hypothetical protein EB796_020990 [Bugula neritina]